MVFSGNKKQYVSCDAIEPQRVSSTSALIAYKKKPVAFTSKRYYTIAYFPIKNCIVFQRE